MTDAGSRSARPYPDSDTVRRELDGHGVLLLTLNRPDRNNAWTIEMEEAYGLVNRIYEPDELLPSTVDYARDMARNCSPASLASIKTQVHSDLEGGLESARLQALVVVSEHTTSPDFDEGVSSYT